MGYQTVLERVRAEAVACGRDPKEITVIAVSKGRSVKQILQVYREGCRHFGENRLNEYLEKCDQLPGDISWDMIGKIQSKKVRKVVCDGVFSLIHSVDSPQLVEKIHEASAEEVKISSILLQVNVSGEISKQGLSIPEWREVIEEVCCHTFVRICGLMTMAPIDASEAEAEKIFSQLREFLVEIRSSSRIDFETHPLDELSMGMSQDFPAAIRAGATLLRIGSAIFDKA